MSGYILPQIFCNQLSNTNIRDIFVSKSRTATKLILAKHKHHTIYEISKPLSTSSNSDFVHVFHHSYNAAWQVFYDKTLILAFKIICYNLIHKHSDNNVNYTWKVTWCMLKVLSQTLWKAKPKLS